MEVNKIECPSCGSNSTFRVSGDDYKCNYCQSNFRVKADENPLDNLQEMVSKIRAQQRGVSAEEMKVLKQRERKIALSVVAGVLILISGIIVTVITSVKSNVSGVFKSINSWQEPELENYKCFLGSKGPVVFLLMKQNRGKLDSVRYIVKLIDPQNNKTLSVQPFGHTLRWKDLFHFSDRMESNFDCVVNDIAYNTPRDSGLIGFDIYTFKEVITASTLQKKFPELSSGISKVSYGYGKNTFKIKTNTAEEFLYDAESNTLRPKEKKHEKLKDTLVDQLYLTRGNRPQLFSMSWRTTTSDKDNQLSENFEKDYEKNKSWYKSAYHITNMKQVSDNVYFMANVLARYKNGLLILYTQDLSKTSPVLLELVGADGKTVWQNKDPLLQGLKKDGGNSARIYCDYQLSNNLCVLTTEDRGPHSLCIDLNTGNALWTYDAPAK